MQINEKILQARKAKGWSQREIAEKLGENRSTYAEWERDIIPRADILAKIAELTGQQLEYFFDITDEKPSQKPKQDVMGMAPSGQLIVVDAKGLTASFERILEEKEARRQEAVQWAERAERDKDRLFKLFEKYLTDLSTNSKNISDDLSALTTEIQAENGAMMHTLDQIAKQAPGTTASKSGSVELVSHLERQKKDKKTDARK